MTMKRLLAIGSASAAVAAVVAGCGGGTPSSTGATYRPAAASAAAGARVATLRTKIGRVLVDGRGRTLYLFEKDKGGRSACDGACAAVWPPLTAGAKRVAGRGVRAARIGSTRRGDGRTEVTYAGHPLYTYAGDQQPGDVRGEGLDQFGAEWYALAASGGKVEDGS
jgi:predicted lipoprotein with Yx(FWY)xxD motif